MKVISKDQLHHLRLLPHAGSDSLVCIDNHNEEYAMRKGKGPEGQDIFLFSRGGDIISVGDGLELSFHSPSIVSIYIRRDGKRIYNNRYQVESS